jgi:ABC-type nitrate/sulfonate/bicarbonate transport system permease component
LFAAQNGIGFNVIQFQRLYELPEMWSGIVILGLIGVGANAIFKRVEKRSIRWYFGMQQSGK